MTWSFTYSFSAEDAPDTDPVDYESPITPEEHEAIRAAIAGERLLRDESKLQDLYWRTVDAIHDLLLEELIRQEDDYTLQCRENGADPFDYAYTLRVEMYDPTAAGDEEGSYWL